MLRHFVGTRYGVTGCVVAIRRCQTDASKTLPGVDLGKRAVDPSKQFPTTWSDSEPLPPNDPRIIWREHYNLEKSKPYYENIKTGEVRWDIPDGFVTRFPKLYAKNGFQIDDKGAVTREKGSGEVVGHPDGVSTTTETTGKPLTMKQKLAAYGGGGLLWYLIVHNTILFIIFCCLYFFRIDLVSIARSYGFKIKSNVDAEADVLADTKKYPPFWKTFILAIVLNKLLVPLQLAFTVATAPFLVHKLEPVARVLFPKIKSIYHSFKSYIKQKPSV